MATAKLVIPDMEDALKFKVADLSLLNGAAKKLKWRKKRCPA